MLPIKEENKFFSKFITKESSIANPSFRVYYGGNSVAVPFVWEAKPGTPKHTKHNFSKEEEDNKEDLPPLTPPPYYLKQPQKFPSKRSFSTSKIFLGLFPKSVHRRQISSASSSSSSTLYSPSSSILESESTMRGSQRSSSSSSSLSLSSSQGRRTMSSPGSLFDFIMNSQAVDDQDDVRSPRSILCFGLVGSRRIRSCYVADP